MADNKDKGSSASPKLQAEIKLKIEQLTRLVLSELDDKHNNFGAVHQAILNPINTDCYTATITADHHQVFAEIKLKQAGIDAIREKLAQKTEHQQDTWDFLGYVKRTPITLEQILKDENLRNSAEIRTKVDIKQPLYLEKGVSYYGLFLIFIKNYNIKRYDADISAPILIPPNPTVASIASLKKQLRDLFNEAKPVDVNEMALAFPDMERKSKGFTLIEQEVDRCAKGMRELGRDEETILQDTERLREVLWDSLYKS